MTDITLTVNLAPPEPRNPVSVYHLGQGFFLAGNRCLLNIEVGPEVTQCLVSPGVVNLCLSIELFLKALVLQTGNAAPRSHKLVDLFSLIPVSDQNTIQTAYAQYVQQPTLDGLLTQVNEYFVKVRYGHEFNIFAFHEHPVHSLARVLYAHTAKTLSQKSGLELLRV